MKTKIFSQGGLKIIAAGENGQRVLEKIMQLKNLQSEEVLIDENLAEKIRGTETLFTISDSSQDMQIAANIAKISKSVDVITFGIIMIGDDFPPAKNRDENIFNELQNSCDTFLIHKLKDSLEFFNEVL